MKIICMTAKGNCPEGRNICCGTCDHLPTCGQPCDPQSITEYQTCVNAETITDELVQFESAVPEAIQRITTLLQLEKDLEEQKKNLKEALLNAMETYGIKAFENEQIRMTYVAPTTRTTIDGSKLKKDHPDIAEKYSKTSEVSASVRITVK